MIPCVGEGVTELEQTGGDDAPCHLPSTEELLLLETAFPKVPKRDRTLVPERKVLKSQENLNVHFIL